MFSFGTLLSYILHVRVVAAFLTLVCCSLIRYVTVNYQQKEECGQLEFIPDYHRAYNTLQYRLIFHNGQDVWHCDSPHTCLQHVTYQLMERLKGSVIDTTYRDINLILGGWSLGQQCMVYQFAKIEHARLNYIECNQKELCTELYSGAKDAMKKDGFLPSRNW